MKKNLTIEEIKNWLLTHNEGDPNENFFYPCETNDQELTGNVFTYYYRSVDLNSYSCIRAFKEAVRLDLERTKNKHREHPDDYPKQLIGNPEPVAESPELKKLNDK